MYTSQLLHSLLISLLLTLMLELLFALIWGIRKKGLVLVILMNILTNPAVVLLHFFCTFFLGWTGFFPVLLLEMAAIVAEAAFHAAEPSSALLWAGAVCYCIQLYFDFSGYSDMAIGLAHMFGFELLENFNYPYAATCIRNFWKRWHISLTSWLPPRGK